MLSSSSCLLLRQSAKTCQSNFRLLFWSCLMTAMSLYRIMSHIKQAHRATVDIAAEVNRRLKKNNGRENVKGTKHGATQILQCHKSDLTSMSIGGSAKLKMAKVPLCCLTRNPGENNVCSSAKSSQAISQNVNILTVAPHSGLLR